MIPEFETLREDEVAALLKAPALVSILIAGADDNIDKNEMKEAIAVAKSKKTRSREGLDGYYNEVAATFEDDFNTLVKELPQSAAERNTAITRELKKLNRIMVKLEKSYAIKLYGSYKDMAKRVAEASGGILGYLSVSYEEAKLLELGMINDPSK
ncbi:MAG: hypothetical protein RJQ09_18180 [Cyclobacteriaceae bacterium]